MASPSRIGTDSVGNFAPSTSDTMNHTVPSGTDENTGLVVAVTTGGDNSSPTAVKWGGAGGTSLTKIVENVGTQWGTSFWFLANPTAMASTVYSSYGSSIRHNLFASTYKNIVQATPLDVSGNNEPGAATSNSKSVTTTADGDILLSLLAISFGAVGITANGSQTMINIITDTNLALDAALSELPQNTLGAISTGFTWTTSKASVLLVAALKYVAPTVTNFATKQLLMGVGK